MRRLLIGMLVAFVAQPALAGAGYDKRETQGMFETRLRVPEAAMAIPAVKDAVFADYRQGLAAFKKDALIPHVYDQHWRLTFEDRRLISLSAEVFWDGGGAHPNSEYRFLVWDKQAGHALTLGGLFKPGEAAAAEKAIASAAVASWVKIYRARDGGPPQPDWADMAREGIKAASLKTYVLTYAAGQSKANGILLLYGAGEIWPHVLGDFRVPVAAGVFAAYLKPEWRREFR